MKKLIILPLLIAAMVLFYQEAGNSIALSYGYREGSYVATLSQQLIFLLLVSGLIVIHSRYEYLQVRRVSDPIWLIPLVPLPIIFLLSGDIRPIPFSGYMEILSITFLIAVNEEIIFRGFLKDTLSSIGEWTACIYCATIFSFFHFPNGIKSFVFSFFLSLLFFQLKTRFNCLWPLILAHILINFAGFVTEDDSSYHAVVYNSSNLYIVFVLFLLFKNKDRFRPGAQSSTI